MIDLDPPPSKPSADATLRLSATQAAFVDDPHAYVLYLGGVGAGKSFAGAVRAMRRRFTGATPSLGLVISPTYPMLRDATWRTALQVWEPLISRVVANEMKIILETGDEVLFRSADDPDRLRGPNAAWAWIDEAALCHPQTWPVTIGRLRQHGELGEAWLTTTPKGLNWVYEVFVTNATEQTAIHRAATWANPFIATSFVDSLRSQYDGDFARQEIEAEFIAETEDSLFSWAWLDQAEHRAAVRDPSQPVQAGLDVAGPGEDETVLTISQAGTVLLQRGWKLPDPRGDVLAALRPYADALDLVNVDAVGLGWGIYLSLRDELGDCVRPVNVGEAPTNKARVDAVKFKNLKAELYWNARDWLKEGMVAGLARTAVAQLASIKYAHDHAGRVQIEPKDQAARRGVKSPDWAESTVLALWRDPRPMQRAAYGQAHKLVRHGRGVGRR